MRDKVYDNLYHTYEELFYCIEMQKVKTGAMGDWGMTDVSPITLT